jgi:hypothetical protein
MVYVQKYKTLEVLSDISTAVHEACHMYQSKRANVVLTQRGTPIDFDSDHTVYYISANEEHLVQHTPTFPSIKMASEITGNLQSFRYETYIKTNQSILGTQQDGIYGLMDEWAAYYNGFKTTVLNFDEYAILAKNDMDPYYNFLQDAGSIRIAYPEFKFYIIHYLHFAQRKEKKIFDQIMANDAFRAAFRAIDVAYTTYLDLYKDKLETIRQVAESKGLKMAEKGDYLMIGNRGVGTFNETYTAFETALNDSKYAAILEQLVK